VPQDYAEAARLYRLAADQGFEEAQYQLGRMYENGQGVPQNYVLAHMWFNLSAARGNVFATDARSDAEKVMSSEQIAEARKLAREWTSTTQPPK
jgi:TPR repeat protein